MPYSVYSDTMEEQNGQSLLGKKVFFLYPPSVIRENLITQLLEQEFEVYMLKDHEAARRLLRTYPNSIIFVNIDAGLSEKEWEEWIRATMADPALAKVGIGIVSYNTDESLQRKYLMDLGIQCGFVRLKLGAEESSKILIETLKANEARGRRKFVRAACTSDNLSGINVKEGQKQINGTIRDISVVGLSCVFDVDPYFKKNSVLRDVQLRLRGSLIKLEAVVFGTHADDTSVYVLIFSPKMDNVSRSKIRNYIQISLQNEIEAQAGGSMVDTARA